MEVPDPQRKKLKAKRKEDATPIVTAPTTPTLASPKSGTGSLLSTPFNPNEAMYKGRDKERERLKRKAGVEIVGAPRYQKKGDESTMQSEHILGHKALVGATLKRGEKGDSREVESEAPAYYEDYDAHHAHVGTGTRTVETEAEGSKGKKARYSSDQYREDQRGLVLDQAKGGKPGGVSAALQLNQAEYASLPGFKTAGRTPKPSETLADDSYQHMVDNLGSVPVYDQGTIHHVEVDDDDRMEAEGGRMVARGLGEGPNGNLSPEQIEALRNKHF
jgi:hypothetical protein